MAARAPLLLFHVHLVQDVGVLRPLVRLARREFPEREMLVLVAPDFATFDATGLWRGELEALCLDTNAELRWYASEFDVVQLVGGRSGLIVAGSESTVRAHGATHRLFRSLPSTILKVTLQHGFECVGFLHSAAHDAAEGLNVRFAADVLASWMPEERLRSMAWGERSKLYVAGPQMLIEPRAAAAAPRDPARLYEGMVCENLHSVRFAGGGSKSLFVDAFGAFARRVEAIGATVHLRSHPAGRFLEKQGHGMGDHVQLSSAPLYRVDLGSMAYGISAPSSILFDFIIAGVPTAMWVDATGLIDPRNFDGLTQISGVDEWWRFAASAARDPQPLLDRQSRFVASLGIPDDVAARYARLIGTC